MIRYATGCDGIGAIHVASQSLGWQCAWTSEIAKFPAAVVDHHFAFPNLGDMTKYRDWPEKLLVDVDVLVGGTPCQSFSVAGDRRSLDDERGNLTLAFVDLFSRINKVRKNHGRPPACAIWENVPGILNTKDNAFGCFLGGLLGCDEAPRTRSGKWDKAGFLSSESVRVGYRVLDAQFFGLAQRRRRVFLLAVPSELVERFGEGACPSEILSLRESVCGNPPPRGAGRKRTARSVGGSLVGRGTGAGSGCIGFNANARGSQLPSHGRDTSISAPLTASQFAAVAFTKSRRARSVEDYETWVHGEVSPTVNCFDQGDTRATTVVVHDVNGRGSKQSSKGWKADGTSYTLTTVANQGVLVPTGVGDTDVIGSSEVAGTLTASRGTGFRSNGTPIEGVAIMQEGVRRLTPTEYERLQGFPDGYTRIPDRRGKPAADGPRYKALGNSMPVPVMRWICERITKAIDGTGQD